MNAALKISSQHRGHAECSDGIPVKCPGRVAEVLCATKAGSQDDASHGASARKFQEAGQNFNNIVAYGLGKHMHGWRHSTGSLFVGPAIVASFFDLSFNLRRFQSIGALLKAFKRAVG